MQLRAADPLRARARAALRRPAPARSSLAPHAFLGPRMEPAALKAAALKFVGAWGRGGPGAEAELRACLAPGVVFRPDGVLWRHEVKGARGGGGGAYAPIRGREGGSFARGGVRAAACGRPTAGSAQLRPRQRRRRRPQASGRRGRRPRCGADAGGGA
jgi:hypothetical protein